MSKDLDLEGDSPSLSTHSDNEDISLKRQTRAMTLKTSSKSESVHSFSIIPQSSTDNAVKEVSEIKCYRTTDLVRQPSRWGVEPSRVVGSDTRGFKASLKHPFPSSLLVQPISSFSTAGDGLDNLSEACTAISTPQHQISRDSFEPRHERDEQLPSIKFHITPSNGGNSEISFRHDAPARQTRDASSEEELIILRGSRLRDGEG